MYIKTRSCTTPLPSLFLPGINYLGQAPFLNCLDLDSIIVSTRRYRSKAKQQTRQTNMGFEDMIKEGEQALDGQTAAGQQAANAQTGGHESIEDTLVDSGKSCPSSLV